MKPSPLEREVRYSDTLLLASALISPAAVVDALVGASRAPSGGSVLVGVLAVVLLHLALASLLVTLSWPVLRVLGGTGRALLVTWSAATPGGVEGTRAIVLGGRAALLLLAPLAAASVGVRLLAGIRTEHYVSLGYSLLGAAFAALAWAAGRSLARVLDDVALPLPGVSRLRAVAATMLLGVALFVALSFERELLFKEIDPWLIAGLLAHASVPLVAVLGSGLIVGPRATPLAAGTLLVASLLVGDLSDAAPLLRVYAPVSGAIAAGAVPLSDFDNDGIGFLLGGADCGPFDASVYAGAPEIPADGIDQDCDGEDLELFVDEPQELVPLPDAQRSRLVVIISVDTLRRDHLGAYGGGPLTPNLDRFAESAVVFDNAYTSGPVTLGAIPGLLTGRSFSEVYRHIDDRRLDDALPRIPEVLKSAGFVSGMVTDGIRSTRHGWVRGFDQVVDMNGAKRERADEVIDRALVWLDEHKEGPRLLWVHVIDPHLPYRDIPEVEGRKGRKGRYAEGVTWMDRHVGRLLERLEGEQATIVFLSDHGEHLGEGGRLGHGFDVYQGNARIPFLVRTPWSEPRRVKTAVWQLDVLPTLAHLAGVDPPPTRGRSLVPELQGAADDLERAVFTEAHYGKDWVGMSTATHRLIYAAHANNYELYDVSTTVEEKHNLYRGDDPLAKTLKRRLAVFSATVRDAAEGQAGRADDHTVDEVPEAARLSKPAQIEGGIEVLGYKMKPKGKRQIVTVYLRPTKKLKRGYKVNITLERDGKTVRRSFFPGKGRFPTNRWLPGVIVPVGGPLKVDGDDGEGWSVSVALVDPVDEDVHLVAEPDPLPQPGE